MTMETLTLFLGYLTLINSGLALLSFVLLFVFRRWAIPLHQRLMKVNRDALHQAYFDFFSRMKVFILVFNLGPYLALKSMGY